MNWLAFAILSYVALGVQVALRGFVEVGGAGPNFVLLVVVFLAINGTRDQSLIGSFVLGLMQDLLTLHPIGTWAVAYALVAVFVFSTQEIVYRDHPLTHFSLALLGGILCGVVLTLHAWLYPMIHGNGSTQGGVVAGFFGGALYTAILAPILIGPLQRMKALFGFRRLRKG
jgi:rod shape-determining protein MreD